MANQTLSARNNVGVAQIVVPGTSSGLVSASGLTGNTTGSAISAGFVGEKITASLAGISQSSPTVNTYYDDSGTLALTAGVWRIHCCATLAGDNPGTITGANVPYILLALRTSGNTLVQEMIAASGQVAAITFIGNSSIIVDVNNSSSVTYKMSIYWNTNSGSTTLGTLRSVSSAGLLSYLYAVRIA